MLHSLGFIDSSGLFDSFLMLSSTLVLFFVVFLPSYPIAPLVAKSYELQFPQIHEGEATHCFNELIQGLISSFKFDTIVFLVVVEVFHSLTRV